MTLDLPVVLWIVVPLMLFLFFALYVLVLGWSASGQVFRGERTGGAPTGGRPGLLVNVVVHDAAVPLMTPAPAEAAVESASPVAAGARQSRAR